MSDADARMLEELEAAITKSLGSDLRARIVRGERWLTIDVRETALLRLIALTRQGLAAEGGGDGT